MLGNHLVTAVAYLIAKWGWSANSKIALKMLNFDDQFEVEVEFEVERQIWLHEHGIERSNWVGWEFGDVWSK